MKCIEGTVYRLRSTQSTFVDIDKDIIHLQDQGYIIDKIIPHEVECHTRTELDDDDESVEISTTYFAHIILYFEPIATKLN